MLHSDHSKSFFWENKNNNICTYMHLFLAYSARSACSSRPNASHIYNAKCTAHMRSHDLVRIRSVLCVALSRPVWSAAVAKAAETASTHEMCGGTARSERAWPGVAKARLCWQHAHLRRWHANMLCVVVCRYAEEDKCSTCACVRSVNCKRRKLHKERLQRKS